MWLKNEEFCDENYLPEYRYSLQEWHVVVGLLYNQMQYRLISREEFIGMIDNIGIR